MEIKLVEVDHQSFYSMMLIRDFGERTNLGLKHC
jgi:hypothetical protein